MVKVVHLVLEWVPVSSVLLTNLTIQLTFCNQDTVPPLFVTEKMGDIFSKKVGGVSFKKEYLSEVGGVSFKKFDFFEWEEFFKGGVVRKYSDQ